MVDFNKTPYLYRVTLDAEKSSSDSKTGHCYFVLDGKTKLIPYDQFEFYSREQLTKEEVIKKCEGSHIIRVSGNFRPIDLKYYTPSLKEFHSGFKYEYFAEDNNEWSKEVFYLNKSHIDLVKYVEADKLPKVRCKLLDKIDIEDLGFTCMGGYDIDTVTRLFKMLNNKGYWVHLGVLFLSDRAVVEVKSSVEENSIETLLVHSITIKNKSELVKLLKQLGTK